MSQLNYLEKLLDLSADQAGGIEVEWKLLEQLVVDKFWIMPATPKFNEGETIPYITSKNIKGGHISFDKTKFISREDYIELSRNRPILAGDFLISMIGTIGEVAVVKESDLAFYGQNMYLIRLDETVIMSRYFWHFFDSPRMKSHFQAVKNNSGQGYLKANNIDKLEIPIPCPDNPEKSLAIQAEIVRILDGFNALIAELTTELNMRKKQYSHYQFELLKFTETTQQVSIGECCDIKKGATPIKKATPGKYPLVATTEERQSSSEYQFDCPAVCVPLISSRGHGVASIDRIYYQDGKFALGNILCAITPKDSEVLSAKFLRYYLFDKKDVLLVPLMRGGANVSLTMDSLKKVKIPIPPIADQQRIVRALDKFDEFVKALPREIELRQKQYEYYRDLLLSFPASPAGGPKSHSDEAA